VNAVTEASAATESDPSPVDKTFLLKWDLRLDTMRIMKHKPLDPENKRKLEEEQRRLMGTINALTRQLACCECGCHDRLEYYKDGLRLCYNCYCREYKRKTRHQAG
jgi:hypothetical protein